jgi:hypothetical protein
MTLRLRDLTDDERTEVQRITRSHTLGAAFVRRAQIVVHAMSGLKAEDSVLHGGGRGKGAPIPCG